VWFLRVVGGVRSRDGGVRPGDECWANGARDGASGVPTASGLHAAVAGAGAGAGPRAAGGGQGAVGGDAVRVPQRLRPLLPDVLVPVRDVRAGRGDCGRRPDLVLRAGRRVRAAERGGHPLRVLVPVAAEAAPEVPAGQRLLLLLRLLLLRPLRGFLRALLLRVVRALPGASGAPEPQAGPLVGVGGCAADLLGRAHPSRSHAEVTVCRVLLFWYNEFLLGR
jgi:hypothetical protein